MIVKIIAGRFKGQTLKPPKSGTHPMGSRERNALMNALGPELIAGASVLDLFAGTGALGLEALSRGAGKAAFVDSSPEAVKNLRATIKSLSLQSSTSVIKADARNFATTERFDLVFVDPPYDQPELFDNMTEYARFVKKGGYLVISHPRNLKISITDKITPLKTQKYAGLALDFFANL